MNRPNSYTLEFRESGFKLALDSDQPVAETAGEIGVHENTLHTWISKYSRSAPGRLVVFSGCY